MKRYVYGNNVNSISYDGVDVDTNGNVHVSGKLVTTVGRFHIFMKFSPSGELLRSDIYRTPYHLTPFDFGIDDAGRRYHLVRTNDVLINPVYSQGLLVCDTLGSPALFKRRDDQIVLPNNVFVPLQRMDVNSDRIAVTGLLHHEHVDLAFTTRYETLLSFAAGDLYTCFMNDTSFAHIPVPLSIITTEDLTTAASIDILPYYSTTPGSLTLGTADQEELEELCVFGYNLLGIEIGLPETSSDQLPLIRQTLIRVGDPIILGRLDLSHLEIWNSSGSIIDRSRYTGHNMIATDGWSPGIYLLRAYDRNGHAIGAERFVLE